MKGIQQFFVLFLRLFRASQIMIANTGGKARTLCMQHPGSGGSSLGSRLPLQGCALERLPRRQWPGPSKLTPAGQGRHGPDHITCPLWLRSGTPKELNKSWPNGIPCGPTPPCLVSQSQGSRALFIVNLT